MALPKWTEERTNQLTAFVGDESPVSVETVADAAEQLETTTRSISSKLRKLGYDVVSSAQAKAAKAYTPEQEAALEEFVTANSGEYTYADIATHFEDGAFSAKSIQGKILSMELTGHVKPAEKVEVAKTYTDEEEATLIKMANAGAFVEDIAEALGKSANSVRGKALSLLRTGDVENIPVQKTRKEAAVDPIEALEDIASMTVADIAAAIGKTERGVKTMLTRRGIKVADYNGEAKKAKADEAA